MLPDVFRKVSIQYLETKHGLENPSDNSVGNMFSKQQSMTMMYSGLDDTTKRRMMQAKALTMEAKGGWWKSVRSLLNHAVYCYNSLPKPLCKRACMGGV